MFWLFRSPQLAKVRIMWMAKNTFLFCVDVMQSMAHDQMQSITNKVCFSLRFFFFEMSPKTNKKNNNFELNYSERTSFRPKNCDAIIQYPLSLDYNKLIDICYECDRMAANQSADKQNTKYYLFVLWTNNCHFRKFERPNIIWWSIEWIHPKATRFDHFTATVDVSSS